ncbi:MAG: hypothetical protein ACI8WB_004823 [Phenylobacterium sp.]
MSVGFFSRNNARLMANIAALDQLFAKSSDIFMAKK